MKGSSPIIVAHINRKESKEGSWHRHARGQLFIITNGLLILETLHGRQMMPTQRAGWIPPFHDHKANSIGPVEARAFYFSDEFSDSLPTKPVVFTPNPLLKEMIIRISSWEKGKRIGAAKYRLLAVLKDELLSVKHDPLYLRMPSEKRLEKLCNQLIKHPTMIQNLEELALQIHMSKRTFTRHFRQQTGLSFAKWCQQMRIMHALELLELGQSVTSISYQLGYQSVSAFIKVFRHYIGMTPHTYKNRPSSLA